MRFGPRPKMMAAWLSSASCWLGRQRDMGAVVRHLVLGSESYWSSPLTVTPALPSCPLAISPLSSSLCPAAGLSCWGTIQLQDDKSYVYMNKGFQSQAYSQPGWQPTEQGCWPLDATPGPAVTLRGALFLMRGMGHASPAASPCEFNQGGAEPIWRRRQTEALTLPAAGRQLPASTGQGKGWEAGLCPLPAVNYEFPLALIILGALPGGVTCSAHP